MRGRGKGIKIWGNGMKARPQGVTKEGKGIKEWGNERRGRGK